MHEFSWYQPWHMPKCMTLSVWFSHEQSGLNVTAVHVSVCQVSMVLCLMRQDIGLSRSCCLCLFLSAPSLPLSGLTVMGTADSHAPLMEMSVACCWVFFSLSRGGNWSLFCSS